MRVRGSHHGVCYGLYIRLSEIVEMYAKWAIAFLNESSWQSSWRMLWSLYKTVRNGRDVYKVLIVEIIMASV
jgi:hypothetical protein